MSDDTDSLRQTRAWVERFVIAHEVCPFARREWERGRIRYVSVAADAFEPALMALIDECRRLDEEPEIETTLVVLPRGVDDFDDYLDLLTLAEALLEEQGYEGVYQLASFHPDYRFDGAAEDDPANYTNRSPYPMLHLLRETSVERALAGFAHPERIPERNIALMRDMGGEALAAQLGDIRPPKRRH